MVYQKREWKIFQRENIVLRKKKIYLQKQYQHFSNFKKTNITSGTIFYMSNKAREIVSDYVGVATLILF